MNELATVDLGTGELTHFDPNRARETQAIRDARIELAARLGNTEALDQEIDRKLDDQEDAIAWWGANVKQPGGDGGSHSVNAESALTVAQARAILGFDQPTISRWRKKLAHRREYREAISRAARKKLQLESADNHRGQGTGENEWYTPAEYVEAARSVLGAIDLDPASSDRAQETVKAAEYFTLQNSGLGKPWHGRVWLNPPYAQPHVQHFVEKLVLELAEERVSAAILLTHNYTDTAWFHCAAKACAVLCFTRGRIAFVDPDGEPCAPTQGQAFFYFGADRKQFTSVFKDFGFIVRR